MKTSEKNEHERIMLVIHVSDLSRDLCCKLNWDKFERTSCNKWIPQYRFAGKLFEKLNIACLLLNYLYIGFAHLSTYHAVC